MKRISNFVASLCLYLLAGLFASNSYADEATIENEAGTYTGEVSNGVANGQGTITFSNGDLYVGEFKNGKQHGQGAYFMSSGEIGYVGDFKNGFRHGQGSYILYTGEFAGDTYVGEWKNDKYNGQGT